MRPVLLPRTCHLSIPFVKGPSMWVVSKVNLTSRKEQPVPFVNNLTQSSTAVLIVLLSHPREPNMGAFFPDGSNFQLLSPNICCLLAILISFAVNKPWLLFQTWCLVLAPKWLSREHGLISLRMVAAGIPICHRFLLLLGRQYLLHMHVSCRQGLWVDSNRTSTGRNLLQPFQLCVGHLIFELAALDGQFVRWYGNCKLTSRSVFVRLWQ